MQVIKRRVINALLIVLIASTLGFALVTAGGFFAKAQVVFDSVSFESEYCVGEEVEIPNVKAIKNETEYSVEKSLILPDGTKKITSKEVLKSAGKYTVVYSTMVDGVKYEKKYDFKAKENLFGLERQSGTAVYNQEKDLIELNVGGNNAFKYNSVIDLSDNGLSSPFLEMYTVSSQDGERDCEQIIITLTDVDDENNYINIRINAAPDFKTHDYTYYTSYVAVSVNGQEYMGKDGNRIHTGNAYGTPTVFSFCNRADGGKTPENDRIQLYYLAQEKQIYVYGTAFAGYGGLVVDFKSEDFYRELWQGFSVDKCKLSLYAANMKTASANLFITSIDGQDLSAGFVVDDQNPDLTVNVQEVPYGIVGYEYQIFDYSARDDYGIIDSSVSAYYDYYSNYPVSLTIEDGKIYPKYQGYYTLVYKATDKYGLKTEKLIDVFVDDANGASLLDITVEQDYQTCLAGTVVNLNEYQVQADEKYGEYQVSVFATCGDVVAEIINDEYFYANAVGTWKVVYQVTDRLGRVATVEKTFSATANPTPIFESKGNTLPKYMLSGKTYSVPEIKAYKYNDNSVEEITSNVKYSLNGNSNEITNGVITPTFSSDGDNLLTITYYVGTVEYTLTSRVVQITKDGEFDSRRLFYLDSGKISTELVETGLIVNATENSVLDYVTPVLLNNFETEVTILNNGNFTVVITDVSNPLQSVRIQLKQELGVITLYVNGVKAQTFSRNTLNVKIINDILQAESEEFSIRKYDNGQLFNGFDSKRMTVSFEITKGSQVKISRVSNQAISTYTQDFITPAYYMDGSFERVYQNGDEVTIPKTYAIDAISGECQVKVSVWGNGKYLTSTDGTVLDGIVIGDNVKFVVDGYGYYIVTYTMVDDADNVFELTCSLYVPDMVKPEISVNGNIPSQAKVGEKISVPQASASDNLSENLTVSVFTIDPALGYKIVRGGEIELNKAGVWTIRFFTMDEEGNITYKDYKVNVKEG